ncbi:MAG: hypothetical protein KF832_17280 [Caldilineaceae bacterium]|nr:hypothetical protein [Caldilineaceae bacterium]
MTLLHPQTLGTAKGDPRAFCAQLHAAYGAAAAKVGRISTYYRIAGVTIQLCFAGPTLVPWLTAGLAHLAIPAVAKPDLILYLWDGYSTRTQPPMSWLPAELGLRGEVPMLSDEAILTAVQPDVNAISVLDRQQACGFYWIEQVQALRAYERAAPLKVLLHWWLRERGLGLIHAGAVGTAAGAALIIGKAGAGKSTTTLACLQAGMHYLSDDRCLLSLHPKPQAYCIYDSAKLHLAQMAHFPKLLAQVRNGHETASEKALVHVHAFAPQQLISPLPIRVLLLAHVAGTQASALAPVARTKLLRDFVTSTLVYQPGAVQQEVQMMTALVRQVPCYQLNLGSDLAGIPTVVAAAIEDAACHD